MAKRRTLKRRRAAPDSADARLEATRALGHAMRGIKSLRTLYIIDACIVALVGLIGLQLGGSGFAIGCGVIVLVAIVGAIRVVQNPVAWTIGLAVVHTIWALAVAMLMRMGFFSMNFLVIIAAALVLWGAVAMARSTMEILRAYPDVWAAKRMRGEGRRRSEMGSHHQDGARARKRMRLMKIAGCIGAVIALFVVIAMWPKKDEPRHGSSAPIGLGGGSPTEGPESSAARLESAWNGPGFEGAMLLVAESEKVRIRRLMAKVIRRRKWDVKALPPLSDASIEPHDQAHAYSHHTVADYGSLRASWEWERDKWVVVRFKLKKD